MLFVLVLLFVSISLCRTFGHVQQEIEFYQHATKTCTWEKGVLTLIFEDDSIYQFQNGTLVLFFESNSSGFQDGSLGLAQFDNIVSIAGVLQSSQHFFYLADYPDKIRLIQEDNVSTVVVTSDSPSVVEVGSSNSKLFFSSFSSRTIRQVNLSNREVLPLVGNDISTFIDGVGQDASFTFIIRMDLNSREDTLFVIDDYRFLRTVDLATLQVTTIYTAPSGQTIFDFTLDEEWFYVLLNVGAVLRVDYSASSITRIAEGFMFPNAIHRTSTGLLVVGKHNVWSVNLLPTCEAVDEDNSPFFCGSGFVFDTSKTDWLCMNATCSVSECCLPDYCDVSYGPNGACDIQAMSCVLDLTDPLGYSCGGSCRHGYAGDGYSCTLVACPVFASGAPDCRCNLGYTDLARVDDHLVFENNTWKGACTPFSISGAGSFIANYFPLNQGEFVVITSEMLRATQEGSRFIVHNMSSCWVDRLDHKGAIVESAISFFDAEEIDMRRIVLQDDGTRGKCAFTLESNGVVAAANVDFNSPAQLSLNLESSNVVVSSTPVVMFDQGSAVPVDFLTITDEETPDTSLVIEVRDVVAGQVEFTGSLGVARSSFQQLVLALGSALFVHDGSSDVPSLDVRVFDGRIWSGWFSVMGVLNHEPFSTSQFAEQIFDVGKFFELNIPDTLFGDLDDDELDLRCGLEGRLPLPPNLSFRSLSRGGGVLSGILYSEDVKSIELIATDPRGLEASVVFSLSGEQPFWSDRVVYDILVSVGSLALSAVLYISWRGRIREHRQKFPLANDLRKVLNLQFYWFATVQGDYYKTMIERFLFFWPMYHQLDREDKLRFAQLMATVLTEKGYVRPSSRSEGFPAWAMGFSKGWPNTLNCKFESDLVLLAKSLGSKWSDPENPVQEFTPFAIACPRTRRDKAMACCSKTCWKLFRETNW